MRLVDGAHAIRADLPASSTVLVDVPLEAGDDLGTDVNRLSSLQAVRDAQLAALGRLDEDRWALTIGGDCGVELASVQHAAAGGDTAVLWIDAHPDLNRPDESPSSAFHGMVLRTLLGDGDPTLVPAVPLRPEKVILVGTRAFDDTEDEFVRASGIHVLPPGDLTVETLLAAIDATGASSLYIHIDLDVLDPSEMNGVGYPEPFGLSTVDLVAALKAAKAHLPLVGAGITEFAPASPDQATDDLPSILRIIGALTR